MQINISEIFSNDVFEENIEKSLDIKQLKYGNASVNLKDPVKLKCHFKKINEKEIVLSGTLSTVLEMNCDRCNKDVDYNLSGEFFKDIKLDTREEDDEDDDFINGYNLDLEKLALSEIYINFPMKVLCSTDCKGICKQCGVNLNDEKCDCNNDDIDPRLSGLKALFDDNFKEV